MTNSLIKKACLAAVGGLAFLSLAKWVGVANQATPNSVAKVDKTNVLLSENTVTKESKQDNVIESFKSDIEDQLKIAENEEYTAYQDKVEWLLTRSSLRGTTIGGAYPIDENGHLVAHISIRHRFDYFMTLLGELSYTQLIQLIEEDIKQTLVDPARSEAITLLQSYQAYKYSLKALDDEYSNEQISMTDREAIINRQIGLYQSIDLLRYEHFEPDFRTAFFEQEIKDEQALIASLQGASFGAEEADDSKLTNVISSLEKQSEETGEDLFDLQSQAFGVEAAQRLSDVRESRSELKARVLTFITQRDKLLASDLTQDVQTQELALLIESSFNESEQKRLPALVKLMQ